MITEGREGMMVTGFGEIRVWLDRPRRWLRPERWAASPVVREMITEDLPAIPVTIGFGYGAGCASRPFYGRTQGEAMDKARDAAMEYIHGKHWRLRPQSQGINLEWPG